MSEGRGVIDKPLDGVDTLNAETCAELEAMRLGAAKSVDPHPSPNLQNGPDGGD